MDVPWKPKCLDNMRGGYGKKRKPTMCVLHMITKHEYQDSSLWETGRTLKIRSLAKFKQGKDDITDYLKAENFIASQTRLSSPPRLRGSTQIGHSPTFSAPLPLTKRGV